jgi:hypothetical protein
VATALSRLREVACEGLLVEVLDPGDGERLAGFARAVEDAGVRLPLAVRVEAVFAEPCVGNASRLVVPVGVLISEAQLAASAKAAVEGRIPVEWELRGRHADLSGLVDLALAASRASGLEEILMSVDTLLPVHGARLVAARLRARGAADVPIVLRHRRDPVASEEEALVSAAVDLGAPLCDGIGDAVALAGFGDLARSVDIAYRVLQGGPRGPSSFRARRVGGPSSISRRPRLASRRGRGTCAGSRSPSWAAS